MVSSWNGCSSMPLSELLLVDVTAARYVPEQKSNRKQPWQPVDGVTIYDLLLSKRHSHGTLPPAKLSPCLSGIPWVPLIYLYYAGTAAASRDCCRTADTRWTSSYSGEWAVSWQGVWVGTCKTEPSTNSDFLQVDKHQMWTVAQSELQNTRSFDTGMKIHILCTAEQEELIHNNNSLQREASHFWKFWL